LLLRFGFPRAYGEIGLPAQVNPDNRKRQQMKNTVLKWYIESQMIREALKDDKGQDLVEYALVIAVVCLGIISGMTTLANGINAAMTAVSGKLSNAVA